MIGFIRGNVVEEGIILLPGGLGYEVHTIDELQGPDEISLFIHETRNENDSTLYGFTTLLQRETFRSLIKVSGVGPKNALALLRELGVNGVAIAIKDQDEKTLTKVKGVGGSVAKKVLLAKLPKQVLAEAESLIDLDLSELSATREVLERLGVPSTEALRIVEEVMTANPDATGQELVRLSVAAWRQ